MSGPRRPDLGFRRAREAVRFMKIHQEQGMVEAFKFFVSFRRMDKLRRAIKELSENQNGRMAGRGQANSGAIPQREAAVSVEDARPASEHTPGSGVV